MIKGVITGDLIKSSDIAMEWRKMVVNALNACTADFISKTPTAIEMYRGDSFQIVVEKPEYALAVAVALRAKLRASTPNKEAIWDARVSVGVGDVSYESDNIATSDGEAFRLSGRAFDCMGKRKLVFSSPWSDNNNAMDLLTRFADDVVSSWTIKQARVVYQSLIFSKTQKELAADLGMTNQNFNSLWLSAKGQLILDYIEYNKSLITQFTK